MNDLLHVSFPIALLYIVFVGIMVRKIGPWRLPIWLMMLCAAGLVIMTGHISFEKAYDAISWDVLFYLFGVFVIGQALESSHYLEHLSFGVFNRVRSLKALLFFMIVVFGFLSALLMNDTIAIVGAPVILLLATQHSFNAKPFLLALAYAVTLGSILSPIGNPQNLLIANYGMAHPFVNFFRHLFIPTIFNFMILYGFICAYYPKFLQGRFVMEKSKKKLNSHLANLCKISIFIMVFLIAIKIILSILNIKDNMGFSAISLISCAPILCFSKQRLTILRRLDWKSLGFFIGLFIFMESVWLSGYFQTLFKDAHLLLSAKATIFAVSLGLSQFISNVSLVVLYLPLLKHATVVQLLSLSAGSTLAGNILILGAASNVIIIQSAEKRGEESFSAWEFLRIGFPMTLCSVVVYYFFL